MKEMSDEELQRWFENKLPSPNGKALGKDANAYRALFEALDGEPASGLPYDFAANVTRKIKAQQGRSSEWRSNLLVGAIFLSLIALVCCIMAVYGTVNIGTLLKYKWPIILLPITFIGIQYFDQVLVKTKIFNNRV